MTRPIVLFEGVDANLNYGLWVTDGTAAGTYELTAVTDATSGSASNLQDLTVFNGEVLFGEIAADPSSQTNLWVTNGTAAGTHELTGISGGNPLYGLEASDLTIFDGGVLFSGLDANKELGLWVTNGTAAGTYELTGISGANSGGIFHDGVYYYNGLNPDFTVFNSEVLFEGVDDSATQPTLEGVFGLWVTNGTAAGTYELTGISGANKYGILADTPNPGFTVFNGEVLFQGYDAAGYHSLWVTNGTAAGTHELTGVSGAGPGGLDPSGFTVFNGEVLFKGGDASGDAGLWATDGTAAGTHELTGISGAYSYGALSLENPDFTVFNGKVLFDGRDTSGNFGLWVTNGTAVGTHELTGISGAYSGGLTPSDFTVFGSEVLFNGYDASGNQGLWVTNGTAAGTYELTPISGASSSGVSPLQITVLPPPPPAPTGLALAAGSDSGVKGDDITNVTKPTITGDGVAGDTVTLYDGTTAIGTATVGVGGTWSVTPTGVLAAGVHTLTATETSATSGTSAASAPLKLTIKTSAPAPAGLSYAVTADKGGSGDTMTVAGKGEARDTVTLYDGTTAIGSAVVAAAGTWSIITASPLAIGAHSLSAHEVDVAANTSPASPAQSITIDSATPDNAVVFVGGAGKDAFTGGAGNDYFYFSVANLAASDTVAGGGGTNYLMMTTAGTVAAGGVSGVEVYELANGGANSLTLSNANFTGVTGNSITVYGGNDGNTVNAAALTGANRIIAVGGAGKDAFTGGAGNDYFYFSVANLAASDTVAGGGGTNYLMMTTAGTVAAGGVSGVEIYELGSGAANSLTLSNANFTGVSGNSITVYGGNDGNTVNASALTGANRIIAVGGAGKDVFTGGAGNDVFHFAVANLAATDTVTGGGGTNYLVMNTAGSVNAGGVSRVEVYDLANGGANSLTLANANFTGVTGSSITVNDGNAGNTVNASGVTAPDSIVVHAGTSADILTGGPGSDVFYAGGDTKMTGGAGANQFTFSAAGSNTIADFTASGTNEIVFSNTGFALGLSGATATPQALPAGLFVSDSAGTFTATTQRFAYGTSNGELFYSASGTTATEHLVATLTGDPTLAASSLHYIS